MSYALRILFSLTILLFLVLHALGIVEWKFINALENKAYDIRLEFTMSNMVDSRIVIVDIDEQSLSEIGRWPWNRSIMAQLVDQLFDTYQIDVLGMDIVFVEPDDSSGYRILQALAQGPLKDAPSFLETLKSIEKTLDYDNLFIESIQNRRIVLGYAFTSAQEGMPDIEAGQLPPPMFTSQEVQANNLSYIAGQGFVANLPKFQAATMASGYFITVPDSDGIVRRVPMLYGYKGQLYESLSLAVTRIALGASKIELGYLEGEHFENLRVSDRTIPVAEYFQALIPYRGKRGRFPYISATEVLHGRIKDSNILKNKIVLLGTAAQGLQDLRATPMETVYPGVEIHATLISGILDNNLMSYVPNQNILEALLLILIGIVMISLLALLSPLIATFGALILAVLIIWLNLYIWIAQNMVLPIVTTLLLILSQFIFNMSYGYFVETTNKRHLTGLFGQYIPPELVDEMSKNPGNKFSMESESREMTVLFSDVRGFTTISEGLEPFELSRLMNEYLTPMTRIIHEYQGTIDKYMGDAIMAFWGAPLHDSQHARHALDASMAMLEYLAAMQPQFKACGWPAIRMGIGLNTGVMNVGNMGSQFRMAYTVLGDAVNLGSRLEGTTKQYGVQIVVSETTKAAVPEYLYRELDRVRVKGKDQPVVIFEPIGLGSQIKNSVTVELADYEQALDHYRHQRWQVAKKQFVQLAKQHPNRRLYQQYAERIEHFLANPPNNDWDGVYTFTTK